MLDCPAVMAGDERRRRRATAASLCLHALALAGAWWLVGPGEGRVRVWFSDVAEGPAAAALAPISLITVELEPRRELVGEEPRPEPAVTEPDAPQLEPEPGPRARSEGGPRDAPPDAKPAAEPSPIDPTPSLLGGRGLAGHGEFQDAGEAPALQGSQAIYAASVPGAVVEGPRPAAPAPGEKESTFVKKGDKWVYRHGAGSIEARIQSDGGIVFRNKLIRVRPKISPSLANNGEAFMSVEVEYDPVGIARAAAGRDPYPRAKAVLLAETFELRVELALRHQRTHMLADIGELERELAAIWTRSGRSTAERKRLLFERWDDCAEPDAKPVGFDGQETVAKLAQARAVLLRSVRAKILRFIAEVAPEGSPDAYTVDELARLNAGRASRERFAPYG